MASLTVLQFNFPIDTDDFHLSFRYLAKPINAARRKMKSIRCPGIVACVLAVASLAPCLAAQPPATMQLADVQYGEFIRGVARQTAQAKTRDPDAVKLLGLGINESGHIVVTEIALGTDHGASFEISDRTVVVAHIHNQHMSPGPEFADFAALKILARPCFVISVDGEKVWEIAVLEGSNKYREVMQSGFGEWQAINEVYAWAR